MPKRRILLLEMLLASVVLAWAGCTPEDHYETLSRFFNDPPKPKVATTGPSPQKTLKPEQAAGESASLKFVHRPYREGKCQVCHGEKTEKRTVALDAAKCLTCHEMAAKKYTVMHTAVTDMACLWCHAPHQSNQPALLRTAAPALCLQCHDIALLGDHCGGAGRAQSDCAECHVSHGGPDRRLLRAEIVDQKVRTQALAGRDQAP